MRRQGEHGDDGPEPTDGWITRKEGPGGRVFVLLVAIGVLALFVLQNTEEIRIDFLFWHGRWPAWIVILPVALLGVAVGWVAAAARGRRLRRKDG